MNQSVRVVMKANHTLAVLLLIACIFSACKESNFFHSPLQGNSAVYRAMPLASDSEKSATYVSAALSLGGMNQLWRDGVYKLQAGVHKGHVLNQFRLNYGAALAAGYYNVKPYYNYTGSGASTITDNGTKSFGAWGLYAGLSAARPLGRRGEWRYIGIEGSLYNEFGKYYNFRRHLADSVAEEVDRHKSLGSLGVNTELVFKGRSGNKFGIKIAAGSFLRRLQYTNSSNSNYYYHGPHDDLLYLSATPHFTVRKTTTWFQLNLATHAAHFQVGFNFKL